jgi:uncharacterized protein (TIGR03083 family)
MVQLKKPEPILIAHLFPKLDERLLSFLRGLSPADWERRTVAPQWNVKDVAAHLLDGNLRQLSILRDGYFGEKLEHKDSYSALVEFLNQLNADWIVAFRRVSSAVLIDLLEYTGKQFCEYMQLLDPFAPSMLSVDWAGETLSMNWFHIAREYTERWHHQQQIRFAVGDDDSLLTDRLYLPYLNTSMRALPHHYRDTPADIDETIRFSVTDVSGAEWFLVRTTKGWELMGMCKRAPTCSVTIDKNIAWRMFTRGIDKAGAKSFVHIEGNANLGKNIFDMTAVIV